MALGQYEKDELFILYSLGSWKNIIEVGANIGVVSRFAFLNNLDLDGRYICVEPNPHSIRFLQSNMERARRQHPTKSFEVIHAGISDSRESSSFFARDDLSSGLVEHLRVRGNAELTIQVPTRSFQSLVSQHARSNTALICDAEGAEIDMILREPKAFEKIGAIAIEFHETNLTGRPETPGMLLSALYDMGYNRVANTGNTYVLKR